ncbi:MAG: hypothetical protein QOE42_435, partial [Chloroflexota bacterium]|nr:hypothetical protein [Chloroflexota bacterium]
PLALLARIIAASTNPGDVVLDPFCGCGTAIDAAQELARDWIGIDNSYRAIEIMRDRMKARHGLDVAVEGAPTEVEGARALAEQHPNGRDQFEAWALSLIGAVPHGGPQKKGADQGADGVITFSGPGGSIERAIVSVKSGHVGAAQVQQLRGAMERHGGVMGLFVTLEEPTRPMLNEAASSGTYFSPVAKRDFPRVQILSVRDILEKDKRPQLPPTLLNHRETLWSDAEVPAKPKAKRKPRTMVPFPQSRPEPVASHPLAETLRRQAAARLEGPRGPRTSARGQRSLLPSREPADKD